MIILEDWELVECDTGLEGNHKLRLMAQALTRNKRKQKAVIRGRHENINGRLKHFNILNAFFRHNAGRDKQEMFNKHGICSAAVAVITQLKIENWRSFIQC